MQHTSGSCQETANSSRKKGFTLIELLVVIAIIAILAAILFPVFARARENARRASCQSNIKQIMLGVFQYTQDYDERYPMVHNESAVIPAIDKSWYNNIQPYLKSTQIYRCPSDSDTTNAINALFPVSYIVNYSFGSFDTAGGISLASVESVATTVYMADGSQQSNGTTILPTGTVKNGGLRIMSYADNGAVSTADINWGGPNSRHLETAIYGFADGHVKAGRVSAYYGAAATPKGNCLNPAIGCQ